MPNPYAKQYPTDYDNIAKSGRSKWRHGQHGTRKFVKDFGLGVTVRSEGLTHHRKRKEKEGGTRRRRKTRRHTRRR